MDITSYFESAWAWFQVHRSVVLTVLGVGSALLSATTVVVIPLIIRSLPGDYYLPRDASRSENKVPSSLFLTILKNLVGIVLVLLGCAMLFLPGQGLLTIVLGIAVMEFPGKKRLELAFVRRPAILRGLNWLRAKLGRSPFEV